MYGVHVCVLKKIVLVILKIVWKFVSSPTDLFSCYYGIGVNTEIPDEALEMC